MSRWIFTSWPSWFVHVLSVVVKSIRPRRPGRSSFVGAHVGRNMRDGLGAQDPAATTQALGRGAPMTSESRRNESLRQMVAERRAAIVPGAADALTARIVAELEFEAVYVTGAGLAN